MRWPGRLPERLREIRGRARLLGGDRVLGLGLVLSLGLGACMAGGAWSPRSATAPRPAEPPGTTPEAASPERSERSQGSSRPLLPEEPAPAPAGGDGVSTVEPGAGAEVSTVSLGTAHPLPPLPGATRSRLLRVGLATDLEEIRLPCCREGLVLSDGERRWRVRSPLRLLPDPGEDSRRGVFRLQVAALKDEAQARELAVQLERRAGVGADVHFDAGSGLYRVRLGRFGDRGAAETARGRLAVLGVPAAWIVGEGGRLQDPGFLLVRADDARSSADAGSVGEAASLGDENAVRLDGRWLVVEASHRRDTVPGLAPGLGRYRGRWLVYLNERGRLNLVNEVSLGDYLRSVVPSEMGPELYGHLPALKAQAVAARSYSLRNLGEFREEGYDICATPRCQVYRGVVTEHPLSDRAVEETTDQVLVYRGRPIDARYSASCGGHTEDVQVVFPLEREPYLRGVPCPEAGPDPLAGHLLPGRRFPEGALEALLPSAAEAGPVARLEQRLRRLASLARLPVPEDGLASLERAEVRRLVGSFFDLALDPRLLRPALELERLLQDPPPAWGQLEISRARVLLGSGLLQEGPGALGRREADAVLLALAEILGLVEWEEAHHLGLEEGRTLRVRLRDGGQAVYRLAPEVAAYRGRGEAPGATDLELVPGDRLRILRRATARGGEVLAVVQELDDGQAAFRFRSRYASWSRFKSQDELARRVADRYPGFQFRDLQVLARGVSGRVGGLALLGAGGTRVEVEGLAVRWTLDVPDTRFTARATIARDGRRGWLFRGSGWGHGVGFCQIGSVNLAGRGADYREILRHYYTGAELARLRALPERWDDGAPEAGSTAARARR